MRHSLRRHPRTGWNTRVVVDMVRVVERKLRYQGKTSQRVVYGALAGALGAAVGGALLGTGGEHAGALRADAVAALLAGLGGGGAAAGGVLAHGFFF